MIVNHTKKFIFIHTPRTGGFSAYDTFQQLNLLEGSRTPNHTRRCELGHPEYYSFGFLRNPWDRLYSSYKLIKYKWNKSHNKIYSSAANGFKEFLLSDETFNLKQPGMFFCKGCTFIGQFEHFERDWNHIFNVIGVHSVNISNTHKSVDLPYVSKENSVNYKTQYDNEMIDYVTEHSKEDINYFNYSFGD